MNKVEEKLGNHAGANYVDNSNILKDKIFLELNLTSDIQYTDMDILFSQEQYRKVCLILGCFFNFPILPTALIFLNEVQSQY